MRALRRQFGGRRFDALLQMQVAARANLLSAFVPAKRRIGYDRTRSKDLHGLFINERIPDRPGIHVLDAIGSFCEPLGLKQDTVTWDLPVPDEARAWARERSEEHTSELQSLMRTSYAVFCLKKKNNTKLHSNHKYT